MASSAVDRAFEALPRTAFLRRNSRWEAGEDRPIPIGDGQTNSQPRTVRDMLELLRVREGQAVLDVGAGSGWTTALLAHLVGPNGRVVGVEIRPELTAWGGGNLDGCRLSWASIRQAQTGVLGVPYLAPYDRILVSAAAQNLPLELVSQLAADGRMVVPVGASMTCVQRTGPDPDEFEVTTHGAYTFVPLL